MNRHENEAEIANLTIIRPSDESFGKSYKNYYLYRFNKCGHTQNISVLNVRTQEFKCRTCLDLKIKQEAESVDLTFISKSNADKLSCKNTARKYNLYRFNKCNHYQDIHVQQVRDNSFKCKACTLEQQIKEADEVNLTLLFKTNESFGKNYKDYNCYKFNSCGHEQNIRTFDIRHNAFECRECAGLRSQRPSNIYIFKITSGSFTWLKLGFAHDLDFRKYGYDLPDNSEIELLYSKKFPKGEVARSIEQKVHDRLKSSKLDRRLMSQYMRKSGFTECYPLYMFDEIIKELNGQYSIQPSE